MAAAAVVKLLRSGGRSSASSSHPLPAIGRQMQQGALTRLLPRLGSSPAAPAAGMRRLMNTGSFPSKLDMLKNNCYMQTKGYYQPYNSMHVILDLQKKVYKIGEETKIYRRRCAFLSVLVFVVAVMALTVWGVHGDKEANKKTLTELKQSLAKTEADVGKLKISISESKKVEDGEQCV